MEQKTTVNVAGACLACFAYRALLGENSSFALQMEGAEVLLLVHLEELDRLPEVSGGHARERIVFVGSLSREDLSRARHMGLRVFVGPNDTFDALVLAIHAARIGASYLGPELEQSLPRTIEDQVRIPDERLALLTHCELATALGRANGLTREELARRLSVSEDTVKSHLRGVYRKLGVADKSDLIAWRTALEVALAARGTRRRIACGELGGARGLADG